MKLYAAILLSATTFAAHAEGLLPCQLTTDKWLIYNPYTACFTGYVEASDRLLWDNDETRHKQGGLGVVYGSVGLGHWLSLHTRAGFSRLTGPDSKEEIDYSRVEQLFLQLGHPVADPFYASAGRIDAPFGLNHDLFRLGLPSRAQALWQSSVNGARIGVGSREGFRLEVGTSTLGYYNPVTGKGRNSLSGRIVRTIDLLDGVRVIASYATSSDWLQRRIGFATLVHNDDNRTSLEWIRLTETDMTQDFAQVFRFVHEQQQKTWSWILSMEDLRHDSYRLSYGINRPWVYNLVGTLSVHYQKTVFDPRDHWILMVGLGFGQSWVWEERVP